MNDSRVLTFPPDFVWGVATAAFQIEGDNRTDGRGESIWDRFCAQPGNISDGSDGSVACGHYRRWRGDVAIIAGLNVSSYRFSIAWPRIVPEGVGAVNTPGLDFYDRLVDELLAAGVAPFPTLYHWDLPQALQDRGGWVDRATAEAFADYAAAVVDRLGDRVRSWSTLNEPFVSADHGHVTGEHAPGLTSLEDGRIAAHHLLLAHGLAVPVIRDRVADADVGIVLNFTPVEAASESGDDRAAAELVDTWENRWYIEPLTGDGYPATTDPVLSGTRPEVVDGDMEIIAAPLDFLGINFYTRQVVAADPEWVHQPTEPLTTMGWEIHPRSLGLLLERLQTRYPFPRYRITENGAAMPDRERTDGRVVDLDRVDYIRRHLAEVHAAIERGMPVDGYFVWSAFDNFEWARGHEKRFGLVEIDYSNLDRTPKLSADWYAEVARTGTIQL